MTQLWPFGSSSRTPVGAGRRLYRPWRRRIRRVAAAGLLLFVDLSPAAGQASVEGATDLNAAAIARADSLYAAAQNEAALIVLRERLEATDSTGYALLWRAARAATEFGTELPRPYPQNHLLEEGMAWGARAEAESDGDVSGGYWQWLATGLRAKNASPRYAAELSDRVLSGGHLLLARDSSDARPHSLLGRLHFEVMSLSRVSRILGRLVVGGEVLGRATWEDAELHLTRAVELAPSDPQYLMDLALLHAARDRPEAARILAERVLASPSEAPRAASLRQTARELIDRLGG